MTTLKITGRPAAAAQAALEPHIERLYNTPGLRILGLVELAHTERTQPAPDADKAASVTVKITHLEVPNIEQEGAIREAQRALYLQRTAAGKLDLDGNVELSEDTLRECGGVLQSIELARLRATFAHWVDYMRRTVANEKLTLGEMRHELDTVADGLAVGLSGTSS